MTGPQKKLLGSIADGADPGIYMDVLRIMSPKKAHAVARTMLALHDAGYLAVKIGGGMAITDAGRAAVERHRAAEAAKTLKAGK